MSSDAAGPAVRPFSDLHTRLSARVGPADMVRDPYLYLDVLVAVLVRHQPEREPANSAPYCPVCRALTPCPEMVAVAEALGEAVEEPTP